MLLLQMTTSRPRSPLSHAVRLLPRYLCRLTIAVYFKETQTPQDKWDVGPGTLANSADALAAGAVKGQVHFFPCIGSASELREQFAARGCAKL